MELLLLGFLGFYKHGVVSLKYRTGIGVGTVVHLGYFYGLFGGSYAISFFDYGVGLGVKNQAYGVSLRTHYLDYPSEDRAGLEVALTAPLRYDIFLEVGLIYTVPFPFRSIGQGYALYPNVGIIFAPYMKGD